MVAVTAPIRSDITISPRYLRAKRALDVVVTLLLLIPLLPLMAVVAMAIKLDSPGPILYRQKRLGRHGVEFEMLKFRSMFVNNDQNVHREAIKRYMNGEALDETNPSTRFKLTNDPRITRVGRFIRKTSLDELPQFFNVLCGEMSLVGPRPPLAFEVAMYEPGHRRRLDGKPGLTGTWQVYGRNVTTFDEMVAMDVEYLERQSVLEDLKLILLTPRAMLHGG